MYRLCLFQWYLIFRIVLTVRLFCFSFYWYTLNHRKIFVYTFLRDPFQYIRYSGTSAPFENLKYIILFHKKPLNTITYYLMEKKFKQWWSPRSTKRTNSSRLNSLNTNKYHDTCLYCSGRHFVLYICFV